MFKSQSLSIIALTILISSTAINAQDSKEETPKTVFIENHMKYLMDDGGVWEAKNPSYVKDEKYSAKTFKYEMKKGIHGENYRIKILADINEIGWYLSWDGYYLWNNPEGEPEYHSLGSNGAIANGTLEILDDKTRVNIFEIISYEGFKSMHKDVTTRVNENEMRSKSYKLNEKGEWEFNQELVWKRVKGD